MRYEWTDQPGIVYHIENGELFTHAFSGGPVRTDPDGEDGWALLREVARLAKFKDVLERLVLALGCLPTQFADEYGHVFEKARALVAGNVALAEENRALTAEVNANAADALKRRRATSSRTTALEEAAFEAAIAALEEPTRWP